ncbi:MAG: hypothetical protein J7501_10005 [Bdellovibrio sp.]|nr:hypothetical protein [Bdellovibrio sp.]
MNSVLAFTILIRSGGASPVEFENFAKAHSESKTYVQYISEQTQENPRLEEELFTLGERLSQSEDLLPRLEQLQKEYSQSPTALHYTFDLTKKLVESGKGTNLAGTAVLNCKARSLLQIPLENCKKSAVDFTTIQRQWPQVEYVMIESLLFSLNQSPFAEISKEAAYQWTLLSNSHQAVKFYGTYEQLMIQQLRFEPMAEGSCDGFSVNVNDFNVNANGLIFFNSECTKKIKEPQKATTYGEWFDRNKAWVLPVGALFLGGVAYSLKDKEIVIEK